MRTMQQKIRRALLEKADIFAAEAKAGIIGNHGRLVLGAKAEALRDFAKYELDAFFPEEDSPMTADDYPAAKGKKKHARKEVKPWKKAQ